MFELRFVCVLSFERRENCQESLLGKLSNGVQSTERTIWKQPSTSNGCVVSGDLVKFRMWTTIGYSRSGFHAPGSYKQLQGWRFGLQIWKDLKKRSKLSTFSVVRCCQLNSTSDWNALMWNFVGWVISNRDLRPSGQHRQWFRPIVQWLELERTIGWIFWRKHLPSLKTEPVCRPILIWAGSVFVCLFIKPSV